jgi:FKBP-type peptidyl-prolyl cis-trans isomerase FklB
VAAVFLFGCEAKQTEKIMPAEVSKSLETDDQKLSYGLGYDLGFKLSKQDASGLDQDALFAGMNDALNEKESRISQAELEAVIGRVQTVQAEKAALAAESAANQGKVFLTENAAKEGVFVTESGLQYQVITEGTGERPTADSIVKTHYHGTLVDGTVFDSSVDRGEPVEFPVNRLIPGWTEALQLMSVGSTWRLFVPSELAYGEQSPGPAIPPNSTLIFDLELIEIVK